MFHKRLTWACDLVILNACCLVVLQAWLIGTNWLCGVALLNFVAVVALRQWLMSALQIPGMTSPLNRSLKRAADLVAALLFLLTVFPVIIVVQAIVIKSSKHLRGPLFAQNEIWVREEWSFRALTFSNCPRPLHGGLHIGTTPLALRLLTGKISLEDISALSIKPIETEDGGPQEKATEGEPVREPLPEARPADREYTSNG